MLDHKNVRTHYTFYSGLTGNERYIEIVWGQ